MDTGLPQTPACLTLRSGHVSFPTPCGFACMENSLFLFIPPFLCFLPFFSPSLFFSLPPSCLHLFLSLPYSLSLPLTPLSLKLSLSPFFSFSSYSLSLSPLLYLSFPWFPLLFLSLQSPEVCPGGIQLKVVCMGFVFFFPTREQLSALFSPLGWLNYSRCVKQCN